jgi:hypothetical protein
MTRSALDGQDLQMVVSSGMLDSPAEDTHRVAPRDRIDAAEADTVPYHWNYGPWTRPVLR